MHLMEAARQNRLLIGKGGLYGNVIRISPPLNIAAFARLLDVSFTERHALTAQGAA